MTAVLAAVVFGLFMAVSVALTRRLRSAVDHMAHEVQQRHDHLPRVPADVMYRIDAATPFPDRSGWDQQ